MGSQSANERVIGTRWRMPETQIEISHGRPPVAVCESRMSLCAECGEQAGIGSPSPRRSSALMSPSSEGQFRTGGGLGPYRKLTKYAAPNGQEPQSRQKGLPAPRAPPAAEAHHRNQKSDRNCYHQRKERT